jgi:hypothetical protein
MPAYVKFQTFPRDFLSGKHDFTTDLYHIVLTNTAPNVATDVDYGDIIEIFPENGYDLGGEVVPNRVLALLLGEAVVTADTVLFAASGGSFGPFRYAVLLNWTHADQRVVAYWDYGSSITLLDTETLTVAFNDADKIFKVS